MVGSLPIRKPDEIFARISIASPTPRLMAGFLSLVLSGAGSLASQIVIQRYIATAFGGIDAVIMASVSFSFLAGLGAGALIGGKLAGSAKWPNRLWGRIDFVAGVAVAFFISTFDVVFGLFFADFAGASRADGVHAYYVVALAVQFFTAFTLALFMGANYPLAFRTLAIQTRMSRGRLAALVLCVNTFGAALGCLAVAEAMPGSSLLTLLRAAAIVYLIAGLIPLLILRVSAPPEAGIHFNSSMRHIRFSTGCFLVLLSGAAGFALEAVAFRHFGMVHPLDHRVFAGVLVYYLVFWAIGSGAGAWRRFSLELVIALFAAGLLVVYLGLTAHGGAGAFRFPAAGRAMEILTMSPFIWIFFLPAFCSGWLYGQTHRLLGDFSSQQAAQLYAANLGGAFCGGMLTKFVLPSYASFVYSPLLMAGVLCLSGLVLVHRRRLLIMIGALSMGLGLQALLGGPPSPGERYYRSIAARALSDRNRLEFDYREDWATSVWYYNGSLYVGGTAHSPNAIERYGGWRFSQVVFPAIMRRNRTIMMIGVGLGISNGTLGKLLPEAEIIHVDYSSSVRYFAERYPHLNDDLTNQVNSELIISDGRLQLMLGAERFDLVVEIAESEGRRGISSIKSMEFLQLAKARLASDGAYMAVCTSVEFLATLKQVFRHVYVTLPDNLCLASDKPLLEIVDPGKLAPLLEQHDDLQRVFESRDGFLWLMEVDVTRARLITDIDPVADYRAELTAVQPSAIRRLWRISGNGGVETFDARDGLPVAIPPPVEDNSPGNLPPYAH